MSYVSSLQPTLAALLCDKSVAQFFTADADIRCICRFEIALANAQAEMNMIDVKSADEIHQALSTFQPDMDQLAENMARDGMIVPGLLRQIRANLSDQASPALHYGATSQDAIDTSAMMRMKSAFRVLLGELDNVLSSLSRLGREYGSNRLMAYTRMQAALPIAVLDRVQSWITPLERLKQQTLTFPLQLGGPVGASDAFEGKRPPLARVMAKVLQIDNAGTCWHSDRGPITEIAQWLCALTGHLGKIGQDLCLMAQMGEKQMTLSKAGTSSSMKHKNNPVHAETLVGLARYNASQLAAIHNALIHEQERSGSSWLLEWMIMPGMFSTTAAALSSSQSILEAITGMGEQ